MEEGTVTMARCLRESFQIGLLILRSRGEQRGGRMVIVERNARVGSGRERWEGGLMVCGV